LGLASKKAVDNCLTPPLLVCTSKLRGAGWKGQGSANPPQAGKYKFKEVLDYEPDNIYGNPNKVRVL